ncbi:MAG: Fic family protein [Planctomycetes bacterium]|nr:Fic family protein [Planctomycetota bacterium]
MPDTHHAWRPIEDLPPDWKPLASQELAALRSILKSRGPEIRASAGYQLLMDRLSREWAIETGILENLYSLDRGATEILIREGFRIEFLDSKSTDKSPEVVIEILKDQQEALDGLFAFVKGQRSLSKSYVRELHQVLTRHQETVTGINGSGKRREFELVRGDWKKWPNNPRRPDGTIHEYCPPEQVESEMDRLLQLHQQQRADGVPAEVRAAWLHHRFTQIHPFQDGNGRIARSLASLEFLHEGWFPLLVRRDMRGEYIAALEIADAGDLGPLSRMFAALQIEVFNKSTGAMVPPSTGRETLETVIDAAARTIQERDRKDTGEHANAFLIGEKLQKLACKELKALRNDLDSKLGPLKAKCKATVSEGESPADARTWELQIQDLSERLGLRANTRLWCWWCALRLDDGRVTNILVSTHAVGSPFLGVMATTVSVSRPGPDAQVELPSHVTAMSGSLEPACRQAFQFTYEEQPADVESRFRPWLGQSLVIALETWRRTL